MLQSLKEGTYALRVMCPECGQLVQFPVELAARLTVDKISGGQLRPMLVTKGAPHDCGPADPLQDALPFEAAKA